MLFRSFSLAHTGPSAPIAFREKRCPSLRIGIRWSNADNDWVTAVGQDYASPASPGRHTVYWSSNTEAHYVWACGYQEYLTIGEPGGSASFPSANEQPWYGGMLQYFNEGCRTRGPYVNLNNSCSAMSWSGAACE